MAEGEGLETAASLFVLYGKKKAARAPILNDCRKGHILLGPLLSLGAWYTR